MRRRTRLRRHCHSSRHPPACCDCRRCPRTRLTRSLAPSRAPQLRSCRWPLRPQPSPALVAGSQPPHRSCRWRSGSTSSASRWPVRRPRQFAPQPQAELCRLTPWQRLPLRPPQTSRVVSAVATRSRRSPSAPSRRLRNFRRRLTPAMREARRAAKGRSVPAGCDLPQPPSPLRRVRAAAASSPAASRGRTRSDRPSAARRSAASDETETTAPERPVRPEPSASANARTLRPSEASPPFRRLPSRQCRTRRRLLRDRCRPEPRREAEARTQSQTRPPAPPATPTPLPKTVQGRSRSPRRRVRQQRSGSATDEGGGT